MSHFISYLKLFIFSTDTQAIFVAAIFNNLLAFNVFVFHRKEIISSTCRDWTPTPCRDTSWSEKSLFFPRWAFAPPTEINTSVYFIYVSPKQWWKWKHSCLAQASLVLPWLKANVTIVCLLLWAAHFLDIIKSVVATKIFPMLRMSVNKNVLTIVFVFQTLTATSTRAPSLCETWGWSVRRPRLFHFPAACCWAFQLVRAPRRQDQLLSWMKPM